MEPPPESEQVVQLPVERVIPNPLQPRRRFDEAHIQALADSIRQQGVIQPVVVRPHPQQGGFYEIVAGERRWRAVKAMGRATLPVLIRPVEDKDLLETALVENLQREQLTPIEEAQAYRDLLELHGYTQETLSRRVGRERSTIANMVRLLALPAPIKARLEEGALTIGHARPLLALEDREAQENLAAEVIRRGLSVRETERLVKQFLQGRPSAPSSPLAETHPHYQAVETHLSRHFGTRIAIQQKNHQGTIEIQFYSLDDFNRLYDKLTGNE